MRSLFNTTETDAYRYFFPAGWALALWGVLLWILFPWNLVSYPGLKHPEIMIGGFFLCFASGFLMTAVPKFTASFGPTKTDQKVSLGLIGFLFLSVAPSNTVYFYLVVNLLFVFLISFAIRRFKRRRSNPPDSFLFVGFGLGSGLVGSFVLLLSKLISVPVFMYDLGRLLFLQAYILCLVLGVGSRLVPALLGWGPAPNDFQKVQPRIRLFSLLVLLFLTSYVLEAANLIWLSQSLRSGIITFIAFRFWQIHQLPKRKGFQSYSLWCSAWFLFLGQWGILFMPTYRIHFLHVLLVSGLGLMTFMIATRVILAHGQHDMQHENNSKGLLLGAILLALAGLTRLSAGLVPQLYQSHLFYASCTWILGLTTWGILFLPKIFVINRQKSSRH